MTSREVDAAVAARVFGCAVQKVTHGTIRPVTEFYCGCGWRGHTDVPRPAAPRLVAYSGSLGYGWEALNSMCETRGLQFVIRGSTEYFRVALGKRQEVGSCLFEDGVEGEGETLAIAMCDAAAKAADVFPALRPSREVPGPA